MTVIAWFNYQIENIKGNRIRPNTIRNTMATRCIEGGICPKTLQVILGHSSVGITMNLQTYVTEDEKTKEVEKIENALKDIE